MTTFYNCLPGGDILLSGSQYTCIEINTSAAMKSRPLNFLSVLVFVVILTPNCMGMTGERKVNLRGDWKFILGDNPSFADPRHNDRDWETIYVPSNWQDEGFRHYNGFAWYRKSFDISFSKGETLYLELGRIDDVDEVYVNGHLIGTTGGFPPDYFTAYNISRTYVIPNEYLSARDNVVAVRVYDEGGEGGILGRNVGIYSYDESFEGGFTLMGNWKFHLFDDSGWREPTVDDKDWENVVVPSTWEAQGFREYDGFAWYRKHFTLPAEFKSNDMVLLLGKIDDMDEAFINGVRVGGTGNIDRKWARDDEWQKPRTYFIPDGILKPGKENVIAVRVYDQTGNGGIFEGPVVIIPRNQYKSFWRQYRDENYGWDWRSWFFDWQ